MVFQKYCINNTKTNFLSLTYRLFIICLNSILQYVSKDTVQNKSLVISIPYDTNYFLGFFFFLLFFDIPHPHPNPSPPSSKYPPRFSAQPQRLIIITIIQYYQQLNFYLIYNQPPIIYIILLFTFIVYEYILYYACVKWHVRVSIKNLRCYKYDKLSDTRYSLIYYDSNANKFCIKFNSKYVKYVHNMSQCFYTFPKHSPAPKNLNICDLHIIKSTKIIYFNTISLISIFFFFFSNTTFRLQCYNQYLWKITQLIFIYLRLNQNSSLNFLKTKFFSCKDQKYRKKCTQKLGLLLGQQLSFLGVFQFSGFFFFWKLPETTLSKKSRHI
eukprot:TRINITY_DN8388_c0_g1_i3.p1 TRINITY_DN8388_c0_g1~~TRINITY_DN8388_c0_g1_i3.p1  ORF type:complete len:327 (-),score=-27.16 TRINITY_DN8388_c0_g1_i3:327-1307(-)